MISFIVAMDQNRVIGKDNQLPWHLPEDLKYFKKVTIGHPIVMGRKTFESIGRPLPGRENIILTRNETYRPEGCKIINSIDDLKQISNDYDEEVFVIGGAEIFKQTFHLADKLYITVIDEQFEGDTFFPNFDNEWKLISKMKGIKNDKNRYDYYFCEYERA
jgi:dihydrofolate reductase